MKGRTARSLALLFCASGALIFTYVLTRAVRVEAQPRVSVEDSIELGEYPQGTSLHVPVAIRNAGGEPLVIGNCRTSCGCVAALKQNAGSEIALTDAVILPEETLAVTVRTSIVGEVGAPFVHYVEFATNDPDRPLVRIAIRSRVAGRALTVPDCLIFGEAGRGEIIKRIVEVRDLRSTPDSVRRVWCERGSRVAVAFKPASGPADPSNPSLGQMIATISVEVTCPGTSGDVEDVIHVELASDGTELKVPVKVTVPPLVRFSPSVVVLPQLRAGQRDFSAAVTWKPWGLAAAEIEPAEVPGDLSVQKVDGAAAGTDATAYVITWHPEKGQPGGRAERVIRWRVSSGVVSEIMETRVYCRQSE